MPRGGNQPAASRASARARAPGYAGRREDGLRAHSFRSSIHTFHYPRLPPYHVYQGQPYFCIVYAYRREPADVTATAGLASSPEGAGMVGAPDTPGP